VINIFWSQQKKEREEEKAGAWRESKGSSEQTHKARKAPSQAWNLNQDLNDIIL